jgi:hypothetical protein
LGKREAGKAPAETRQREPENRGPVPDVESGADLRGPRRLSGRDAGLAEFPALASLTN